MGTVAATLDRPTEPTTQAVAVARQYGTPPVLAHNALGELIYEKHYIEKSAEWADAVYSSSSRQMGDDPTLQQIPKWIRVLSSDHWLAGRPSYRATPVVNRILRFWLELQSAISDVRMNTYVHSENKAYAPIAENVTKASFGNWQSQDADLKLMGTVQHASMGIGYTKIGVNPKEMEVSFLPYGADSVIPILPNLYDLQESGGVICQYWKPLSWFWDKYSILARDVKPEATGWSRAFPARPHYIDEYTWSNMNSTLKSLVSPADGMGEKDLERAGRIPMAKVKEFWFQDDRINTSNEMILMGAANWEYIVKPGEPVYPFGRLMVTAGEDHRTILYDGPNFHWHGCFPFADLRLRPVVWLFSGLSVFADLFPINTAINQLLADLQDMLKQILNPTTIVRDRAMSDDAWEEYFSGLPGRKIKLINMNEPVGNLIHWEHPDGGSLGVIIQAIQMLIRLFDEQAGLIDTGQLMQKKQVPSGDTVEQIQNIRQSVFRLMARFVDVHVKQLGRMQVSDIFQFYDRQKMVAYLGPDGNTWMNLDWDPNSYVPLMNKDGQEFKLEPFRRGRKFVKQFRQLVTSGSSLPSQRMQQLAWANATRARRDMSLETYLEYCAQAGINTPDYAKEVARLNTESKELPQPPPKKGGAAKPPKG